VNLLEPPPKQFFVERRRGDFLPQSRQFPSLLLVGLLSFLQTLLSNLYPVQVELFFEGRFQPG